MQEYNISSFLKILQSGIPSLVQGPLGILVLDSIASREDVQVNIDNKRISNLINRKEDVPNPIQVSSTKTETIVGVIEYFNSKIISLINPHIKEDVYFQILQCINNDPSAPVKQYEKLHHYLEQGDEASFLSYSFLYAISRPNKIANTAPSIDEYPLLEEVRHRCPICLTNLLRKSKGKTVRQYNIVSIFPENLTSEEEQEYRNISEPPKILNSIQNKIPLCLNHANTYSITPTIDIYVKLREAKEAGLRLTLGQEALSNLGLETKIKELIDALEVNLTSPKLEPLKMDALKIDKKILPENYILKFDIQRNVLEFFIFIKSLFAEIADFEYIQSDISRAFKKLHQTGLSQPEIVEHLTQWILDKTSLGEEHRTASHIIVSYFIQNCEVFYEITE